jgi:hypothetical protein
LGKRCYRWRHLHGRGRRRWLGHRRRSRWLDRRGGLRHRCRRLLDHGRGGKRRRLNWSRRRHRRLGRRRHRLRHVLLGHTAGHQGREAPRRGPRSRPLDEGDEDPGPRHDGNDPLGLEVGQPYAYGNEEEEARLDYESRSES